MFDLANNQNNYTRTSLSQIIRSNCIYLGGNNFDWPMFKFYVFPDVVNACSILVWVLVNIFAHESQHYCIKNFFACEIQHISSVIMTCVYANLSGFMAR